jgi:hypothetical protein
MRTLSDRLRLLEERALVLPLVERAVRENFKEQPVAVFESLPKSEDGQVQITQTVFKVKFMPAYILRR